MTKAEFDNLDCGQGVCLLMFNEPYEIIAASPEALTVRMIGTPHHAPFTTFIRPHDEDLRLWVISSFDFEITHYGRRTFVAPETDKARKWIEANHPHAESGNFGRGITLYEEGKPETECIAEVLRRAGFTVKTECVTYVG